MQSRCPDFGSVSGPLRHLAWPTTPKGEKACNSHTQKKKATTTLSIAPGGAASRLKSRFILDQRLSLGQPDWRSGPSVVAVSSRRYTRATYSPTGHEDQNANHDYRSGCGRSILALRPRGLPTGTPVECFCQSTDLCAIPVRRCPDWRVTRRCSCCIRPEIR